MNSFFKGVWNGFGSFGHCIASIVNFVLLGFVYLIGVGFTFIFAKLFRKHFLDLKISTIEKYYRSF